MKYYKDADQRLEKCFRACINKYFPVLGAFNFLFLFREGERLDSEGGLIAAEVSKVSNRDRDLYGFDIRVEVDTEYWKKCLKEEKFKLAYHELSHISPVFVTAGDPDSGIKEDKEGRLKYKLLQHDIVIKRFKAELEEFGLSKEEERMRRTLNKIAKMHAKE